MFHWRITLFRDRCRHLGRNPFLCDCYLTWLADYLHRKPVETSGVRCESPRRMQRRRISILREEKSRCSGTLKKQGGCFCGFESNVLLPTFLWNKPTMNKSLTTIVYYMVIIRLVNRTRLGAQLIGNQPMRRWSVVPGRVLVQRHHRRLLGQRIERNPAWTAALHDGTVSWEYIGEEKADGI